MQPRQEQVKPAFAAQLDWMQQGAFNAERFSGKQRAEYEAEQRRIERQWDNQPR